jgi:hypothetical protein
MRNLAGWIAATMLTLATVGCGDEPSKGDCEKLLDHMIDVEIAEAGTDSISDEMKKDIERQKSELREYLGKEFVDKCVAELPEAHVACALKARTKDDIAKCEKK